MVIGVSDHGIRSRLLREKTLTLDSAVDLVRAAERSKSQLKQIEKLGESPIHTVRRNKGSFKQKIERPKTSDKCKYCGRSTELYYISGVRAPDRKVSPKTWRILRHNRPTFMGASTDQWLKCPCATESNPPDFIVDRKLSVLNKIRANIWKIYGCVFCNFTKILIRRPRKK